MSSPPVESVSGGVLVEDEAVHTIPTGVEEETVSMQEVVQRLDDDARQASVIAARAGQKVEMCSYHEGYVSQPVYWCRTCHPAEEREDNQRVGICLGCSLNCHLNHELEELFEKRQFRCDCGNVRAGGQCLLIGEKDDANPLNQYNHNFAGRYCFCDKSYDAKQDEMYQCYLCQDWFHDKCISEQPVSEDENFFCRDCIQLNKYTLLIPYLDEADKLVMHTTDTQQPQPTPASQVEGAAESSSTPGVEEKSDGTSPDASQSAASLLLSPNRKRKADDISTDQPPPTTPSVTPSARSLTSPSVSSPLNTTTTCRRLQPSALPSDATAPVKNRFVSNRWSSLLCTCDRCRNEWREAGIEFILDEAADDDGEGSLLFAGNDITDDTAIAPAFDINNITNNLVSNLPVVSQTI